MRPIPEGPRRALILGGAAALLAAAAWASRGLPDPVGEAVVVACEAAIAEARPGEAIEIAASRDERTPAPPEEWGPTGPAGDTLHAVEVAYGWRARDGDSGQDVIRCAYVERASDAVFDPARLRVETAAP